MVKLLGWLRRETPEMAMAHEVDPREMPAPEPEHKHIALNKNYRGWVCYCGMPVNQKGKLRG